MKLDCIWGEPWRLAEIDYLLSSWITIISVVLLPCNIVVCQHTNLFSFLRYLIMWGFPTPSW